MVASTSGCDGDKKKKQHKGNKKCRDVEGRREGCGKVAYHCCRGLRFFGDCKKWLEMKQHHRASSGKKRDSPFANTIERLEEKLYRQRKRKREKTGENIGSERSDTIWWEKKRKPLSPKLKILRWQAQGSQLLCVGPRLLHVQKSRALPASG